MDRVSLVIDCADDAEATQIFDMLASQLLDGRGISLRVEDAPLGVGAQAGRSRVVR